MASLVLPDHDGQQGNYKNALNALLQRITGQSMGKTDITYDVVQHGSAYQCTTTINCLDGQQASGDMKASEKEAEQEAALQAILALEQDLKTMGYSITDRTLDVPPMLMQAVITAGIASEGQDISEALTDAAIKAIMHGVITKVVGRKLDKGDITYNFESSATAGMFHATLTLPSIPGELGTTTWQGADSPFRRDSQLDCALKALDSILTDPVGVGLDLTGMVNIRTSAEKKAKEKASKREKQAASSGPLGFGGKGGKGKGGFGKTKYASKGGCKGGFPSGAQSGAQDGWVWMGPGPPPSDQNMEGGELEQTAESYAQTLLQMNALGLPAGMLEIFSQGFNFGNMGAGGKSKGKGGKAGNGKGPRKRISDEPCTGDVVVWKEKFGMIQPHFEVSHPHASKHEGKIYVNARDVEGGELFEGQSVTFFVYDDGKGLGAEEVAGF